MSGLCQVMGAALAIVCGSTVGCLRAGSLQSGRGCMGPGLQSMRHTCPGSCLFVRFARADVGSYVVK